MNRTFLAACGAAVLSAALVSAQDKPSSHDSSNAAASANANTVTFTGCLNVGSKADSYYLTSAKQKGVKNSEKSLKVVAASPKVKLEPFVTNEVEVTGTVDQPTAASGADNGAAARTLTVTKVKVRTQYCG